jgi:two-component system probable response regulator PhcQ
MYNLKKYAILFVDDEINTLKSFKAFFKKDFRIFTAQNSIQAEKILEQKSSETGILISDHVMPDGVSGLDLLKKCNRRWPSVLCILTTVHSDYGLLVESINSGAVYKYIVKPWDVNELGVTLRRAMEFFLIREERNLLLKAKMRVLQELILSDRMRGLLVLTAGLSYHLRNTPNSLKAFLSFAPDNFDQIEHDIDKINEIDFWKRLTAGAKEKTRHFIKLVKSTGESVIEPNNNFKKGCSLYELVCDGINDQVSDFNGHVNIDINPAFINFQVNEMQIHALFKILFRHIATLNPQTINFQAAHTTLVNNRKCAKIFIFGEGVTTNDTYRHFWELFPVFLIVYHHNGKVVIKDGKIEIDLPFETYDSSEHIENSEFQRDYITNILSHFEVVKHYEAWIDVFFSQ